MPKNPRDLREPGVPPRVVKVLKGTQEYNGHFYRLSAPDRIMVCSAYGSDSARLTHKGVDQAADMEVAKRLMKRIVDKQGRF